MYTHNTLDDVAAIAKIAAVPTILETVYELTGLGFVCVARVTADSWTTCAVLDKVNFGLKPGDTLDIETTICKEVRERRESVVIDEVSQDPMYRDHPTPKIYGFESYFSTPIYRSSGEYFGSLCGIDAKPKLLSERHVLATLKLFAQLISVQLQAAEELASTRDALRHEMDVGDSREKFIAVLTHDLRNPLGSITAGTDVLMAKTANTDLAPIVKRIKRSAQRIEALTYDLTDLVRGRLGAIDSSITTNASLSDELEHVVAELNAIHNAPVIAASIEHGLVVDCNPKRLGQLASNLLKNALDHGDKNSVVIFGAFIDNGKLVITVRNQGPTLSDQKLRSMFKPYWRDGYTPQSEGLGLGLFIVSEIASAHHGAVNVQSQNGETTFTFVMPVKRGDANSFVGTSAT